MCIRDRESTIQYIKDNDLDQEEKEEVWVVFDFDINEDELPQIKQEFNAAIELANKHNIKCATSNDSFELWYILHFLFTDMAHRRDWYNKKLSEILKVKYSKDKKVSIQMYNRLKEHQKIAIRNAKKLEKIHKAKIPCDKNPYSSVYNLVEALNEYIRD